MGGGGFGGGKERVVVEDGEADGDIVGGICEWARRWVIFEDFI